VPITQPILTGGDGHYDFYAQAAVYTIVVGFGGLVQEFYPDQSLGGASGTSGGGGMSLVLSTNGAINAVQNLLNLQGSGTASVSSDGAGNVTIIGSGIPTGGTAGQILSKIDGTNFNTEWVTPVSATSGSNVVALPQLGGATGGLGGFTIVFKIPASLIAAVGSSGVIVTLWTGTTAGGLIVDAASIGATLPGTLSTGVVGTNPVAWTTAPVPFTFPAGSFAEANTRYPSNACPITIDSSHDYYVLIYIDSSTTGNAPYSNITAATPFVNCGGYVSGNQTDAADSSGFQSLDQGIIYIAQVTLA
jgi:hypothetical protein